MTNEVPGPFPMLTGHLLVKRLFQLLPSQLSLGLPVFFLLVCGSLKNIRDMFSLWAIHIANISSHPVWDILFTLLRRVSEEYKVLMEPNLSIFFVTERAYWILFLYLLQSCGYVLCYLPEVPLFYVSYFGLKSTWNRFLCMVDVEVKTHFFQGGYPISLRKKPILSHCRGSSSLSEINGQYTWGWFEFGRMSRSLPRGQERGGCSK